MPRGSPSAPTGSVQITSNVREAYEDVIKVLGRVPLSVAAAATANAEMLLAESNRQLQAMVYDQPDPRGRRTYRLARGQKKKRLGVGTWVVYNDTYYAEYVHDGSMGRAPRPWMYVAGVLVEPAATINLVSALDAAMETLNSR